MLHRRLALLAAICLSFAPAAHAADWPTRPLTMINPFAPGGPNDVVARLFAQRMGEILGQSVIVENVGGAGGMKAPAASPRRSPTATPSCKAPSAPRRRTRRSTRSRPTTRRPISRRSRWSSSSPGAGGAQGPAGQNMTEFVAYAKANQDKMQYGSAGTGSAIHLGCALINWSPGSTSPTSPIGAPTPRCRT